MAHEARTDFAVLLGSIFLLIVGVGAWSFSAANDVFVSGLIAG
jgi:hypothetical protein